MPVITIAREMGSMGDKLGRDLAARLGYELLDKEIIHRVAQRTGAAEEEVEQYDEKTDSAIVRFLTQLFVSHPDMASYYGTFAHVEPSYSYGVAEPYGFYEPPAGAKPVDPKTIVKHFEEIIRRAAERGRVVIVGRASQIVLKDVPDALHIRTIGQFEWRVQNVMRENPDLSRFDAEQLVTRNDRWRERYLSVNYNTKWGDPLLYHLVVPMDKWEWARLLNLIACIAER